MHPLQKYSVIPRLPEVLAPMWDLAYNFLFSWKNELQEFFAQIDPELWIQGQHNPVRFLNHLPQTTLEELAKDTFFLERLNELTRIQEQYNSDPTSNISFDPPDEGPVVAYFSAEYGVSLSLPIYSGGLGILAGDHLKSASDLNIPLVAVGLCYQQGYFNQYLTQDGWQQERYPYNDFDQMPLSLVRDKNDAPLYIGLNMQGMDLNFQIWRARIGRIVLYLLDTNIPPNPPEFKNITAQLYGGDLQMRIRQEILLGIGGIKALHSMGLHPKVIHMNEGHSAFAGLERIRIFMHEHQLSFEAALELVASSSVFTTHTPVPAGNDRFPPQLMEQYFEGYARDLGLAFKVFLALGRENPRDDAETFCMTVLALKLSRFNNGVSKLHGQVSRKMWQKVWPQYPVEDVPIKSITNGVHIQTWIAPDIAYLMRRYMGSAWQENPHTERIWTKALSIPDAELWRTHERLRERLVDFSRKRLKQQVMARGGRRMELQIAEEVLDPQALTIGFARRFASYKRAYLLLRDKERLISLLDNSKMPIQFVIAGKAHPRDNEGKKIIQQLVELCKETECRGRIVFIENYDMEIAAHLVQGCDIWLNTPRRPLEACGTSGMKAMINGALNVSTLDGWWYEAYRPDNSLGWSIGQGEEYTDNEYQDFVESQILFNLLEKDIVPLFYTRDKGNLPRTWIKKMKDQFASLGPRYNGHRMVEEYARMTYLPAYTNYTRLTEANFGAAKDLSAWRMDLMTKWSDLRIQNVQSATDLELYVDEQIEVTAEVQINGLRTEDIQVEIYAGPLDHEGRFTARKTSPMRSVEDLGHGWHLYRGSVAPLHSGKFGYTVRILPSHPLLLDPHSLGLIHWA
ncbi:alpha-glucan family phosphorylase [Desulfoplanes sp.]